MEPRALLCVEKWWVHKGSYEKSLLKGLQQVQFHVMVERMRSKWMFMVGKKEEKKRKRRKETGL